MNAKDASFLRSVMETRMKSSVKPTIPTYKYRGQEDRLPSLTTEVGNAPLKPSPVYSGEAMVGIATMHKSNAVPVFSTESAEDISKMRR